MGFPYVHTVDPKKQGKLKQSAKHGILIGYSKEKRAYRILLEDETVVESRDVRFLKEEPALPTKSETPPLNDDSQGLDFIDEEQKLHEGRG